MSKFEIGKLQGGYEWNWFQSTFKSKCSELEKEHGPIKENTYKATPIPNGEGMTMHMQKVLFEDGTVLDLSVGDMDGKGFSKDDTITLMTTKDDKAIDWIDSGKNADDCTVVNFHNAGEKIPEDKQKEDICVQ